MMTTVATCPDLPGHLDLYNAAEKTWRLTRAEKRDDWADGRCGHCGGQTLCVVCGQPLVSAWFGPECAACWLANDQLARRRDDR